MSTEVTPIVSVWLKHDDVAAFEAFERRVARIQARHGGRIERAEREAIIAKTVIAEGREVGPY